VQDSCNSINGLCWWQKLWQESSTVTRALTWKCNPNLWRFLKALFLILMLSMDATAEMPLNHWACIDWDFKVKEAIISYAVTPCLLQSVGFYPVTLEYNNVHLTETHFPEKWEFQWEDSKRWRMCCLLSYLASASSHWLLMCLSPLC